MLEVDDGKLLRKETERVSYIAYWTAKDTLFLAKTIELTKEEQDQLVDFIQAGPPKKWVYVTGSLRIHEDGTDPEVFYRHANRWYNDREDALWVKAYQMGLVIGDWKNKATEE